MVECDQLRLYIGSGSHLLSGAKQNANLTAAHLTEHLLFLRFRGCGVDIGDLLGGDALGNELCSQIVIDIELSVIVWGGQVAEDHLSDRWAEVRSQME